MNKIVKALFSFVVVGLLVLGGLVYLSNLTERKESKAKFSDFYEQEEDFDVLFLGSSHTINGVFPMELWNDYGIVSYNMAVHAGRTTDSYWLLKNALEYTAPELVVIDCCLISWNQKHTLTENLHKSTNHIPFSKTKVEMIRDLVGDVDKQWDFLWEFSTYHNRWNDLKQEDFDFQSSLEKGAESRIAVTVPSETVILDSTQKIEEETIEMEYLRRIIEECQEQEIEVLLTYLPFPDNGEGQEESNTVWDIAEEYNVNYLDYHTLMAQVNFDTDCYDKDSHLNPSGARKITEYIGNYINSVYAIEDQRENEAYSHWHEDYKAYTQFKHDNIRNVNNLKTYLMLLKDKNLSYGIYLEKDLDMNTEQIINELLLNIGIDMVQVLEQDKCFVFVDNVNQNQGMITISESMETYFGEISLIYNQEEELELIGLGDNRMVIDFDDDVAIVVFDNRTLSLVDQAKFRGDNPESNMERQND